MGWSLTPMRPQTRQAWAPAMPKVFSSPQKRTVIRLHSVMFATSSGIQTVKGMRASSPGRTLARLAVMACTQPSATPETNDATFSGSFFPMAI